MTTETKVEAVAWTTDRPAVEGAYYVRGFNLFRNDQYEALVQVRMHHYGGEPLEELCCNLHSSTSEDDMDDWIPIVDMSGEFQWLGPLIPSSALDALRGEVERAVGYSAHLEEVVATRNLDWYTEKQRADAAERRVAELEAVAVAFLEAADARDNEETSTQYPEHERRLRQYRAAREDIFSALTKETP